MVAIPPKPHFFSSVYKEATVVFLLIAVVLFLLTQNSIFAPCSFEDDHKYIQIANPELKYFDKYENKDDYNSLVGFNRMEFKNGRFYPFMLTVTWVIAKLGGTNSILLLRLSVFALGVLSGVLFFLLLRLFNISRITSFLFSGILLGGNYDEIFYRGTAESWAIPLLLLSLFCFAFAILQDKSKWNIYGFIALVFSALTKESFVVMIPVVALLYLVIYAWKNEFSFFQALRKIKIQQFIFSILFAILFLCVIAAVLNSKNHLNGGEMIPAVSISALLNNIGKLMGVYAFLIPIAILFLFNKKLLLNRYKVALIIIWMLWIGSQLFIYSYKSPILTFSRYLMPGLLFSIFLTALCMEQIRRLKQKYLYWLLIGIFSFLVFIQAKNLFINSSFYASRATAYNKMLDAVAKDNPTAVAVFVEEGGCLEFIYSVAVQLSYRKTDACLRFIQFFEGNKIKEYDIPKIIQDVSWIEKTPFQDASLGLSQLQNDSSIKYIIFATPLEFTSLKIEKYKEKFPEAGNYSENYYNINLKDILSFNRGKGFSRLADKVTYICLKRSESPTGKRKTNKNKKD